MTVGERIRQRRLELGLSQEELAHRLGNKSRASVCTVENDKEDLTTDRIRKYAEALNTTPAYIMGWEDKNNPINKVYEAYQRQLQTKIDDNIIEKAAELYDRYKHASPEARKAVEVLLKFEPPQS